MEKRNGQKLVNGFIIELMRIHSYVLTTDEKKILELTYSPKYNHFSEDHIAAIMGYESKRIHYIKKFALNKLYREFMFFRI